MVWKPTRWVWSVLLRWRVGVLVVFAFGFLAQAEESDPFMVKQYPDGTRVKVRWSQVDKWYDAGGQHGGPPKIRTMREDEEDLPEEVPPANPPPRPATPAPTAPTSASVSTAAPTASSGSAPAAGAPKFRTGPVDASPLLIRENEVLGAEVSGGFPSNFSRGMGPSLEFGQAFQDYGPSTMPTMTPGAAAMPKRIYGLPEGKDEQVTVNLIGIAFLGKPEEVNPEGMPDVSGVRNTVPGLPDGVAAEVARSYLGKAVTLGDLNKICRQITAFFEEEQKPVVSAVVPEQEVKGGVVQVLVVRGKMGKVQVEGNRWFKSENLAEAVELQPGEDLDIGTLTDNVAWLNGNPFRQVSPSLTPGETAGTTDVLLTVQDRFPVRPFASVDNFGVQSLGYNRFSTGLTVGDVWTGLDQQFNYQFLMSGSNAQLLSNSGSYVLGLPWQNNLNIFGTYSKANPDANGSFDQNGYFWQVSMRYNIPLPTLSLLEGLDYRHQAYLGYDYKASNTDIFFQGQAISATTNGLVGLYSISQFVLGYSLNLIDPLGSTAFETVLFGSPGGMGSNNDNAAFQNIDGGADAQYIYGKFSINRLFRLPGDASILLSGQIQQADSNLMPSESFGIGGYDTVRGYDQRAANGDNAYLGNIEIRSPPISFWQMAGEAQALDQLIFLAFLDYGQVLQYSSDTTTSENWHLMSIGPGFRYNIGPYFSVRFDWGFQLQQAPPGTTGGVGGRAGTSQGVLSATLAY